MSFQFGVITKVRDLQTNKLLAIKRSKKAMFRQTDEAELQVEADFLHKLRHDNVIQLLQVVEHGHEVCLVMPYMAGSLYDELRRQGFNSDRTKYLMRMILHGLKFIHQ